MPSISRRTFLAAGSAAIALPALAAGTEYKEAPSLRDRVAAGSLPPVRDRLPENPLVIKPVERVGKYGGDWNHALVGGGSLSMVFRYQAYEPLLRYTPDWSGVDAQRRGILRRRRRGKVYTIRLRKGMKWSDGQPYTTDDMKFWYDTVLTDKRVAFVGQDHWKHRGRGRRSSRSSMTQTFKVIFTSPTASFRSTSPGPITTRRRVAPSTISSSSISTTTRRRRARQGSAGFESWIALLPERSRASRMTTPSS